MTNILITGGAGFIGSNLALKLIQSGYQVTVLDNLSPQIHGISPEHTSPLYNSIKGKVYFIKGSVTERETWKHALKDQNIVIHLAAETGTGQSMYEIEKYTNVNVQGTALLLDLLTNEKHTVSKVLVASSRAIYGEGRYWCLTHGIVYPLTREDKDLAKGDFECKCPICGNEITLLPTTEDSLTHPTSVYGITKQIQEQLVMTVCPTLNIAPIALRYQNVYGAGQSLSNPYTGILSIFSTQIKNGHDLNIFEDGIESRDFVYIDDSVDATIRAIKNKNANGQVFNVGTGVAISVKTVANILIEKYNSPVKCFISGNYRPGDIRHNIADISKITASLGFIPQYDFLKGIQKFVDWVNLQDIQIDKYDESISELKKKGLFR